MTCSYFFDLSSEPSTTKSSPATLALSRDSRSLHSATEVLATSGVNSADTLSLSIDLTRDTSSCTQRTLELALLSWTAETRRKEMCASSGRREEQDA